MIELKRRAGKDERLERDGNCCGIAWGPIIGGALGAAGSLFGGGGGGRDEQQTTETQFQDIKPQWAKEQLPYLFSGQTWNPYSVMPSFTPEALQYGQGLMQGGTGSVLGLDSLLAQIYGGGQGFQDLLGMGQMAPPPLLSNNPLYEGDLPPTGGNAPPKPEGLNLPPGEMWWTPPNEKYRRLTDNRYDSPLGLGLDMIGGME